MHWPDMMYLTDVSDTDFDIYDTDLMYLTLEGSQPPGISLHGHGHFPYGSRVSLGIFSKESGKNAALTRFENKLIKSVTICWK